jgi:isocitrate dehydrogenase
LAENHLRWDSLGEFLALGPSLELLGQHEDNPRAAVLARALDQAVGRVLEENRSPSRRTGELDNRGSHFYLALYWAQALADQSEDSELADTFAPLADRLARDEQRIAEELQAVQGSEVDLGGYYLPDRKRVDQVMRPSETLNAILREFAG